MDQQRRLVQGRLSEVFGPKALTTDRALRTLWLCRYAAATGPLISSEFMGVLDAYAPGVNAFLDGGQQLPIDSLSSVTGPTLGSRLTVLPLASFWPYSFLEITTGNCCGTPRTPTQRQPS